MSLSNDCLFIFIVSFYWLSLSLSISNLLCINKVKHSSMSEFGSELPSSPMGSSMLPAPVSANRSNSSLPSSLILLAMFQEWTMLCSRRSFWISELLKVTHTYQTKLKWKDLWTPTQGLKVFVTKTYYFYVILIFSITTIIILKAFLYSRILMWFQQ